MTKSKIKQEIQKLNQQIKKLKQQIETADEPNEEEAIKCLLNVGFSKKENSNTMHYVKPIKGTTNYYFWFYFDWLNAYGNLVSWGVADDAQDQNYNDIENEFDSFESAFKNFLEEEHKYQMKKLRLEFEKQDLVYIGNIEGDISAWWDLLSFEDGKVTLTEINKDISY